MNIQNLVDAALQALMNIDTTDIKGILRNGSHADYIFASMTDGRVCLSARDLFLRVYDTIPENFIDDAYWRPNYDDALGNVLLHLAAYISDYELIKLLLEHGAQVTSIDKVGKTAVRTACVKASLEIIKFLTEKSPAYVLDLSDEFGNTPLDHACDSNCPEVVRFLLSQGSSVGAKDERFPVLCAVCNKVPEYAMPIATLLLDAGANINQVHCGLGTPLTAALVMHRFQMEHAPNSVTSQNSPYADLCMLLIDRGCNVNADYVDGKTALHLAIIAGFENVVQKLLVPRSDMDRCDHLGNTPLHYACENGSQRLVDLLIIYGL